MKEREVARISQALQSLNFDYVSIRGSHVLQYSNEPP